MVAMRPDAELEINAVRNGLRTDELQHLEITIPFFIGQINRTHAIARDRKQKGVGKQEVSIANLIEEVVANAEVQAETIPTLSGQHREVCRPHLTIVEPGFVLNIATKDASDAANSVERPLDNCVLLCERRKGTLGMLNAVGKFEQSVHQSANIATSEQAVFFFVSEWNQRKGFAFT